ncbi:MAG TPA: 4Fe-4S binding protein [Bacteroidales bacterium]|nr:4Fe-4S binding protein [Bacteroidales bacterium]
MKKFLPYIVLLLLLIWHTVLIGQDRFPRPEFESGYVHPENQLQKPRAPFMGYVDVAVLIAALSVTTWLALKKRSRTGLVWMSVFSLAYFGFYREGCICAVGSVQNVSLALFNQSYGIPVTALLFFIIPLVFALLYGRVFCAGVCPLGAIQELTGIKPLNIPRTAEIVLASVPFIYLGLAILFSALNSQFLICRYDPFVGIFRLDAPYTMLIFGILLLLAGAFVNRPYCRFLCPYGVLLNVFSRFAGKHLSITPAECTNCRLCEEACPYNAIIPADTMKEEEPADVSRTRFILNFLFIPLFAIGGSLVFYNLAPVLAGMNNDVRLAREIRSEQTSGIVAVSKAAVAYKESGKTEQELFTGELNIVQNYKKGSPWVGLFLGASLGISLVSLSIRRKRTEYKPDQGKCFSCGRCFKYCPVKVKTAL